MILPPIYKEFQDRGDEHKLKQRKAFSREKHERFLVLFINVTHWKLSTYELFIF